jgi:hypothetical protein
MNYLKREIDAKLEALTSVILSGQLTDYPAYREAVGRINALRELKMFMEERNERLANGEILDDQDD